MTVEYRACHRFARIAPRKAQPVMDLIRGMPVSAALDLLRNDNHRASALVQKVLASAIANACNQNQDVRPNRLVVSQAHVNGGPLLFGRLRYRPTAMGRALPFRRRTCHLHVRVADPGVAAPVAAAPGQAEEN